MEHSQYRTIVKRVYPHEGRRKVLIAFFALMLATATGIFVGMYAREEFPALEGGATASREQIAQLSLETEADRQTISTLRDQLSERVSELAELEEILAFYSRFRHVQNDMRCRFEMFFMYRTRCFIGRSF